MPDARSLLPLAALVVLVLAVPPNAGAQNTGTGSAESISTRAKEAIRTPGVPGEGNVRSEERTVRSDPDFLFGRPAFSVSARMGMFVPRARGVFFDDFIFPRFTLDRRDFRSFTGGVEAGVWLSDHVELIASLDGSGVTRDSEYVEWVEETPQGDVPIRQTTRLAQGPLFTAGVKVFPVARGESLGQFAWVPRTAAPFVSAGFGGGRYHLEQWGDFVDEGTETIFTDEFRADGGGLVGFVGGGVDVTLSPRVALVLDGRYFWGEARMTDDFNRFPPLDLGGLRMTAGLAYRF
jgi:hypothetical protein